MSHIPFDRIVDHVRELDHALDEAQAQVRTLWLAGRGAASLVPHEGEAIADMISDVYGRYEDGLSKAREIQQKLVILVKDVTSP
ncbi:hypothetical protein [Geminicoccus roseus]|uniref:hypothetical protein n=1 Tax=Geminicoccus roseus TaxID=404900 RepID=UPI0003F94F95|nr:hypothetical protein [Geminicoccus roseus]